MALSVHNVQCVTAPLQLFQTLSEGYALSTENELHFCKKIAVKTGIFVDRVYSGKALKGTVEFLEKLKQEGKEILEPIFIHTGGIHSIGDSTFTNFIHNSYVSEKDK